MCFLVNVESRDGRVASVHMNELMIDDKGRTAALYNFIPFCFLSLWKTLKTCNLLQYEIVSVPTHTKSKGIKPYGVLKRIVPI